MLPLINNGMKIRDVLTESTVTDIVARFYVQASEDSDRYYNPEVSEYKDKNKAFYKKFFEEWFDKEIVPVFTQPTDKSQPPYTVDPKPGKSQSPGYRGLQYARARSGMPYDKNVQGISSRPPVIDHNLD